LTVTYYQENGKIANVSILEAWDLTIHAAVNSTEPVLRIMTSSTTNLTTLKNSSPDSNFLASDKAMAPNNGASEALPDFRTNPVNSQNTAKNPDSMPCSIYSMAREFLDNSKLHAYLSLKVPHLVRLEKRSYTLYEVLVALREVISREKLFDQRNSTVIICNADLEEALEMKALHVTEIKNQVCKQLIEKPQNKEVNAESCSELTTIIEPTTVPVGSGINKGLADNEINSYSLRMGTHYQPPLRTDSQIKSIQNFDSPTTHESCPTAIEIDLKDNPKISGQNALPLDHSTGNKSGGESENIDQHGASSQATMTTPLADANFTSINRGPPTSIQSEIEKQEVNPTPHQVSQVPFTLEGKFLVQPSFLKVIRKVNGVDPTRTVFTYRELTNYLSQYILHNKSKFFDKRNHMVAICEGDSLAEAFGVRAFHRSQVNGLIKEQLIPYKEPSCAPVTGEMDKSNNGEPSSIGQVSQGKGSSRKRCPLSSDDEDAEEGCSSQNKTQGTDNTSSYLYVKRQRRRTSSLERPRSISVTVTTFDYSSSGDETIYSAQGYETAAIGDMEDLASEDDFEEGNIDEEAKENIRARAAAAAADAVAAEDAVPAETPERYKPMKHFVTLKPYQMQKN